MKPVGMRPFGSLRFMALGFAAGRTIDVTVDKDGLIYEAAEYDTWPDRELATVRICRWQATA